MKILMLSDYFPPEIGSASFLFYELAKDLTKKGDKVSVVTGFPNYNINKRNLDHNYWSKLLLYERMDGIDVYRIKTFNLCRNINVLRGIDQFLTAFLYFTRALFLKEYDYILIYSPPLTLGLTGYLLKIVRGKKTVINVQDLFPKSAADLGALKNKFLLKFFTMLEKFVYLKSDYITVHSPGNMKHIQEIAGDKTQTAVIPNWVNTEEIIPGSKDNEFSRKYNLLDKFVISFTGILGESQDLDIILNAAKKLNSYKDILFIIVGDGRKKKEIEIRKRNENINNLVIIPLQAKQKFPLVLHSSDIGLVTIKSIVRTPVVPSKIINIMAAGIPVVASLPLESDALSIIKESEAGFGVEAGNLDSFVRAIETLYKDKSLKIKMGDNGRKFIENNHSLQICSDMYKEILNSFSPGGPV